MFSRFFVYKLAVVNYNHEVVAERWFETKSKAMYYHSQLKHLSKWKRHVFSVTKDLPHELTTSTMREYVARCNHVLRKKGTLA